MPASTPHPPITRRQEIALVAGRELRAQLFKRSAVVSTLVMLALVVGGIVVAAYLTDDDGAPYRLGTRQVPAAMVPALEQVVDTQGQAVRVVDVSDERDAAVLGEDAPQGRAVDMVLDLGASQPALIVREEADESVEAGVTAVLQQSALSGQITALGGDPGTVASALASAAPELRVLEPPEHDSEGFGARYSVLMTLDVLLLIALMGGGQVIAMGVVEEKASRIVEILLACVRPTSLLAGKILGTGIAFFLSTSVVGLAGWATATATGVVGASVDLDTALAVTLAWMVVGFAIFAVAYGAAASLVSRQEDVGAVLTPLTMIAMIPYILSFVMALNDPDSPVLRALAFLPPFAPFMMPARLVLGVSSWMEQAVALGLSLAFLPLLVRLAARIYTRSVTRTGARVPLREALGRTHREATQAGSA